MLNLVEKFTPASDVVSSDEGVVTIEYVLVAGVVVAFATAIALFGPKITTAVNNINL